MSQSSSGFRFDYQRIRHMTVTAFAPYTRRKTLENTYAYGNGFITILAGGEDTGGAFGLFESILKPGSEPPLHVHEREDELLYILEGDVRVKVGDKVHSLSAGDTIFLPRGVPHTFRIKSAVARGLTYLSPAGFVNWFRTIGAPAKSLEFPVKVAPPSEEMLARMAQVRITLSLKILTGPVDLLSSLILLFI